MSYVPPGMGYGPDAPEWATQPGGPANLPIVGWTCQNSTGSPFAPWSAQDMGTVPDWTSDPNPAAAGSYDMNVTVTPEAPNTLNRGPIGAPFFDAPGADAPLNPNTSSQFSQGHIGGDLEW